MEISISKEDAKILNLNMITKAKIIGLFHLHIGNASAVSVKITDKPPGVQIEADIGIIVVDRALTKRIDTR